MKRFILPILTQLLGLSAVAGDNLSQGFYVTGGASAEKRCWEKSSNLVRPRALALCVNGGGLHPHGWLIEQLKALDLRNAPKSSGKKTDLSRLQDALSLSKVSQLEGVRFTCAPTNTQAYRDLKRRVDVEFPDAPDLQRIWIDIPCTLSAREGFEQFLLALSAITEGVRDPNEVLARSSLRCDPFNLSVECLGWKAWLTKLTSFATQPGDPRRELPVGGVCLSNKVSGDGPLITAPTLGEVSSAQDPPWEEVDKLMNQSEGYNLVYHPALDCFAGMDRDKLRGNEFADIVLSEACKQKQRFGLRYLKHRGCEVQQSGRYNCEDDIATQLRQQMESELANALSSKTKEEKAQIVRSSPEGWRRALNISLYLRSLVIAADHSASGWVPDPTDTVFVCGMERACILAKMQLEATVSALGVRTPGCYKVSPDSPIGNPTIVPADDCNF